jgi:germination protein M
MTTLQKTAIAAVLLLLLVPLIIFGYPRIVQQSTPTPQPVPAPAPAPAPEPTPTVSPDPTPEPVTAEVLVYFVRGEKIGVGGREVNAAGTAELATAAVRELLAGPTAEETEFGLITSVPKGTKLNGVSISGNTATVDLSRDFESGGGSLSMQLRAAQVVYTLTQFEGVDRVQVKLDGTAVDYIGGEGVPVGPSVGRSDFEAVTPPVLVEAPYVGQRVSSPLTVSGTSNVFEATHQLNVTDPEGLIVYDRYVTATSGSGERGTWEATVEFTTPRDGFGAVIVFEYSAKDGKQINVVEIPVRM